MGRGSNRMSDWVSRKQFRVTNSLLSAATDYQIRFQVYRSTGTDTATDVYIGTNCQEDFSDIRWTDSTGIDEGLYEYWIESPTTSAVATCWVKMRYLPANSATTVYLYYNNPNGVSAYSSGSNTFPFFDDFPGTGIDTDKWDSSGTVSVSSSEVAVSGGGYIRSKTEYGLGYITEHRSKTSGDTCNCAKLSNDGFTNYVDIHRVSSSSYFRAGALTAAPATETDTDVSKDTVYHQFRIDSIDSGNVKYYIDDVLKATHTTDVPTGDLKVFVRTWGAGVTTTADWVLLRKYLSTEPTVEVVESGDTNTTNTKAYRIVGLEFDQDTGLFTIEFGAVEDYYMSQDAKYRGAYDTSLSLM